jgi:general secretion pathway protein N
VAPGIRAADPVSLLVLQWKDWPPGPSRAGLDAASSTVPNAPVGSEPDPAAQLPPPDPKDAYASVTDRPLFRPERRPEEEVDPEAQGTAEPDVATSLEGMNLSAVIITPTLVSAWIQDPNEPRLRRLRIGDDLEGWSVQTILPDRVLLERQGEQDALILRDYGKTPSPAAPMPVPRRPPRVLQPADPPDQ